MNFGSVDNDRFISWNRKILNVYWVILGISFVVAFFNVRYTTLDPDYFLWRYVWLPTLVFLLLMTVTEILFYLWKSRPNSVPYIVVGSGTAIAAVLISSHPTVHPITGVLLLPLLASCIYFRKRIIFFALGTAFITTILLLQINTTLQEDMNGIDITTWLAILIGGATLAVATLARGQEILQSLQHTMESKQDLMAQKVLMEKMAKTDALTGLNNHMTFYEYLDDLLTHSSEQCFSVQIAIIDIDNFKKVNDTYGHQTGDLILKRVANKIRRTVTLDDFVARYGGEEFAIIFIDKSMEESFALANRVREEIAQEVHEELHGRSVTVSIGMHEFAEGVTRDKLFEGADRALYLAKRTGKNRTNIYQPLKEVNGE